MCERVGMQGSCMRLPPTCCTCTQSGPLLQALQYTRVWLPCALLCACGTLVCLALLHACSPSLTATSSRPPASCPPGSSRRGSATAPPRAPRPTARRAPTTRGPLSARWGQRLCPAELHCVLFAWPFCSVFRAARPPVWGQIPVRGAEPSRSVMSVCLCWNFIQTLWRISARPDQAGACMGPRPASMQNLALSGKDQSELICTDESLIF